MSLDLLKRVVKEGVAMSILEAMKVADLIEVGDNKMLFYLKNGVMWTVVTDAVNYLDTQQSQFLNQNYTYFVDETTFNTLLYSVVDMSGVGNKVVDVSEDILPFVPPMLRLAVANGTIKVGGKLLVELAKPMLPQLNIVTNVSTLWNNRA